MPIILLNLADRACRLALLTVSRDHYRRKHQIYPELGLGTHVDDSRSGVGRLIGLSTALAPDTVGRISTPPGCSFCATSSSLVRHPPRPPVLAIPPPSRIWPSTSRPVLLMIPVRSLGVAGREGSIMDRPPESTLASEGSRLEPEIAVFDVLPVCADVVWPVAGW